MSAINRIMQVLKHPYWAGLSDDEGIHRTGSRSQNAPTFKLGDLRRIALGTYDDFPILRTGGVEYVPAEHARLVAERDAAITRAERAEIDVECYLATAQRMHQRLTESEASVSRILGKLVDAHKRIAELEARAASRGAPTWIGIVDPAGPLACVGCRAHADVCRHLRC